MFWVYSLNSEEQISPEVSPEIEQKRELLIKAFRNLRSAALLMLIAYVLIAGVWIAVLSIIFTGITVPFAPPHGEGEEWKWSFIAIEGIPQYVPTTQERVTITVRTTTVIPRIPFIPPALILATLTIFFCAIAILVLVLVATYAKLLPGAKALAQYNPDEFGTASTMIRVGYIAGPLIGILALVLLIIGAVIQNSAIVFSGLGIGIAAIILLFIGFIGLVILCFKINSVFESSMFLAAGILFIVGIFVAICDLIAWILVYVGASEILRKVQRGELKI